MRDLAVLVAIALVGGLVVAMWLALRRANKAADGARRRNADEFVRGWQSKEMKRLNGKSDDEILVEFSEQFERKKGGP